MHGRSRKLTPAEKRHKHTQQSKCTACGNWTSKPERIQAFSRLRVNDVARNVAQLMMPLCRACTNNIVQEQHKLNQVRQKVAADSARRRAEQASPPRPELVGQAASVWGRGQTPAARQLVPNLGEG